MTARPASPKKETARISLPGTSTGPALPKATVKMQQTQPLSKAPTPALNQTIAIQQAAAAAQATPTKDTVALVLSIAACLTVGIAVYMISVISNAAALPSWAP